MSTAFGSARGPWVLLNERLATEHPEVSAQMVDGTPRGDWLCPFQPAAAEYALALVDDDVRNSRPMRSTSRRFSIQPCRARFRPSL